MSIESGATNLTSSVSKDKQIGYVDLSESMRALVAEKKKLTDPKDIKEALRLVTEMTNLMQDKPKKKKERIPGEKIKYILEFEDYIDHSAGGVSVQKVEQEVLAIDDTEAMKIGKNIENTESTNQTWGFRHYQLKRVYPGHLENKLVEDDDGVERFVDVAVKDEYED